MARKMARKMARNNAYLSMLPSGFRRFLDVFTSFSSVISSGSEVAAHLVLAAFEEVRSGICFCGDFFGDLRLAFDGEPWGGGIDGSIAAGVGLRCYVLVFMVKVSCCYGYVV